MNAKQFIIVLVAISFILILTSTAGIGATQPSGSGTLNDPYKISNWEHIDYIRNDTSATYTLQNNITTSTSGYDTIASPSANSGNGFDPIQSFSGSLDGNGYHIDGLYIDRSSSNVGLFGTLNGSKVQNLVVKNTTVAGTDYVGVVAGDTDSSANITEIFVSGTVEGNKRTGGLIGRLKSSNLSKSASNVDIEAANDTYVGGLVGTTYKGATIKNSYALSDVNTTADEVGGVLGNLYSSGDEITNTYATGNVSGSTSIGGIIGLSSGYIDSSYYFKSPNNGLGTQLNKSDMLGSSAETSMTGFNFTSNWKTIESGFPILRALDEGLQLNAQGVSRPTYNLTVNAEDSNGNAINTSYQITNSSGFEVASGNTGSDGSVTESIEEGDYTVKIGSDNGDYEKKSKSVNLTSDSIVNISTTTSTSESTSDPSIDAVLNDSNYNNTGEIGFNDSATFEIQLTNINDSEVNSYDWRIKYVPNVFEVADEQVVNASTTTTSGETFSLSNDNVTNITSAVTNDTSSGGGEADITSNVSLDGDRITVNYSLNSSEELLVSYEYDNTNDELITENFSGQTLTYTFENDIPTDIVGEVGYTDSNGNVQTLTDTQQVLDSGGSIGSGEVGETQIPIVPALGGLLGILFLIGTVAVVAKE